MEEEALQAAAELCRLVDAPDLVAWLGLHPESSTDTARAALERERKRMQSMQGNPKYKDVAKHLIKSFRKLDDLLGDVGTYLKVVRAEQASTQLPLLELVIDGVLADGVLTAAEEAFVRDQALRLGIAVELYERILHERCASRGVTVPQPQDRAAEPVAATVGPNTGSFRVPMRALQVSHRAAGTGWWDAAFTTLLLQSVPPETKRMVDLAAGLGWCALSLLPQRPTLEYLGIDPNELHVDVARRNLAQAGLGDRAILARNDPSSLPLPDGAVDLVTCIMSLQGVRDSRPIFGEAARLLRTGGRFLVVEPDCTNQVFWYDGPMVAFTEAFQALCFRVDEVVRDASGHEEPLGQPGIALGPELGRRMAAVGLDPADTFLHPVQVSQRCTFPAFARRVRKRIDAMRDAAGLAEADPLVRDADEALSREATRHAEDHHGTGTHLLPLFLVAGYKD